MSLKILITGASGFIGSNLTSELVKQGFDVFATCRSQTSFLKCIDFKNQVKWINLDNKSWKESLVSTNIDVLIHLAWSGLSGEGRNNWQLQMDNFIFSKEIFDTAKLAGVKKIISFGSQAEYGKIERIANEDSVLNPYNAYGVIKILTCNYLRLISNNCIQWYWIRLYSLFGERDSSNWVIPSVIKHLLRKEKIRLSKCEQKYDFTYIGDFVIQILEVIRTKKDLSGIYNLCSSNNITIKDFLIEIAQKMNANINLLEFGSLPYRNDNQMLMIGNNDKFQKCFLIEPNHLYGRTKGLINTIMFHNKNES